MNTRQDMTRTAAALLLIGLLALTCSSRSGNAGVNDGAASIGGPSMARGMLIPARLRLIVRFKPSQNA